MSAPRTRILFTHNVSISYFVRFASVIFSFSFPFFSFFCQNCQENSKKRGVSSQNRRKKCCWLSDMVYLLIKKKIIKTTRPNKRSRKCMDLKTDIHCLFNNNNIYLLLSHTTCCWLSLIYVCVIQQNLRSTKKINNNHFKTTRPNK